MDTKVEAHSDYFEDHVEDNLKPDQAAPSSKGHVEGNALLFNKDGEIRKIPVPTDDPNDPLNFRKWEKYAIVFVSCWFSIMGISMASGLGSILETFFGMYAPLGATSDEIVMLITVPTLCIGLGNFILLPFGLAFGRRPVFLVAMVVLLAATIWGGAQNSLEQHLGARILQGLATGASESLLPLMLTEVTFLHERSRVFALYWTVQNVVSSCLNLSSSYLVHDLGWRWYYWVFVITVAVGLVIAFCCAFETQFDRPAVLLDGQIVVTDESGATRVIPDSEAQEYLAAHPGLTGAPLSAAQTHVLGSTVSTRKSYIQRIKPWSTPQPNPGRVIVTTWVQMLQSLCSPGIIFAVLASSITLGVNVGMSLTYNTVLMNNFGWAPQDIGLIAVGGVVGSLLGMLYSGLVGQKLVMWLARRNKGVHLPEHELLTNVFPAIVGFATLLLYGFTATNASGTGSWWGPYLAWTFSQYSFTAIIISTTTFATQTAIKHPGPALVVVVGSKNIISFGATYGLNPMLRAYGYDWAFGVLAGIYGAIFVLGIPVYFLNPKFRAWQTSKHA
ncbi:major facilitator superfamily domain-containing protein [Microdochium trichocladiopsis]|uniref:Major facilitator superfamily domain-containing protein n=1 Tax=Microdochium trichocladiopsis TaxID=1682393 RepID=A0A9P8YC06_9PEZI|nr:major facilitator superfamily domain-containing protein [Microdochium trichocladiopsis]KAH7033539.1 major facilitator superfamily domain-containing protein [Microdochium trichocladiopsis]